MTTKRGVQDLPHPTIRLNATSAYEDSAQFPEAQDSTYAYQQSDNDPRVIILTTKSKDNPVSGHIIRPAVSLENEPKDVQTRSRTNERQLDLGRTPYLPGRASSVPKPRSTTLGYMKATLASAKRITARSASPTMIPRPSSAGAPQRPVSASRLSTMSREISSLRIPYTSKGIGFAPEVTAAIAGSPRVTLREDVQDLITRSQERREQASATTIATRNRTINTISLTPSIRTGVNRNITTALTDQSQGQSGQLAISAPTETERGQRQRTTAADVELPAVRYSGRWSVSDDQSDGRYFREEARVNGGANRVFTYEQGLPLEPEDQTEMFEPSDLDIFILGSIIDEEAAVPPPSIQEGIGSYHIN